MRGISKNETLHWLTGNEGGTAVTAGNHGLWRFEIEVSFGLFSVVTGEAILLKKGDDFLSEVDHGVALQISDRKRGFLRGDQAD